MKENNEVSIAWTDVSVPGWMAGVEDFCHEILKRTGIENWELSVMFCDDKYMRELNSKYRNKDAPTDVLSFSMQEDATPWPDPQGKGLFRMAGDIVISVETLERNALADAIPPQTELKRLLIHGILHLKGMDHTEEDASMIDLQEKILSNMDKEEN
jgi:probable rRNA maturation factor